MKQSKVIKKVLSVIMATAMLAAMTSCKLLEGIDFSFEGKCKTTEDGFVYFVGYKEGEKDKVYIISLPDSEEVTIPEYIDGKKVVQLGYHDIGISYDNIHTVIGKNIKKLIIKHNVNFYSASFNIDTLVYLDFEYIEKDNVSKTIKINNFIGNDFYGRNTDVCVELRKSGRIYNIKGFIPKTIEIPLYVKIIEAGTFAGLKGVSIKTEYESKPDGWEDGWNGTCEVEWGVNLSEGE